ncbi:hypothetical protein QTP70_019508 [Hemibagrus guttatus]|uniref:Uncharacterized protein n=1 Tax=Hemibagrus guttatus TaxID=175788 RepID=A0AAE0R553_9TELE|nr:hypothetical protein QTP70_019508 [Hemibagrus guttatus]
MNESEQSNVTSAIAELLKDISSSVLQSVVETLNSLGVTSPEDFQYVQEADLLPENMYLPGARSVCDCPSKQSSTAIAKKMVAKYPASLQDLIEGDIVGSGYHSLVKQMQNRIENVKRPNVPKIRKRSRTEDSDTEEIPAERKAAV